MLVFDTYTTFTTTYNSLVLNEKESELTLDSKKILFSSLNLFTFLCKTKNVCRGVIIGHTGYTDHTEKRPLLNNWGFGEALLWQVFVSLQLLKA